LKDDDDDDVDYVDVEVPAADICICGSCSSADDQNNSKKCCLKSPCLSTDSQGNDWFLSTIYVNFFIFHVRYQMNMDLAGITSF
jgi:hypothetical protein